MKSWLRSFLKDWKLKLLALLATLFLYNYVRTINPVITRNILVHPRILNLPPGFVLRNPQETRVSLTLKGESGVLGRLDPESVDVFVDFSEKEVVKGGVYVLTLYVSQLPPGVVLRSAPREIPIRISQLSEKSLPVEIRFLGSFPKDVKMENAEVQPERATIRGPAEQVQLVSHLVASLATSSLLLSPSVRVPLTPVDASGFAVGGITVIPDEASVSTSVQLQTSVKPVVVHPQLIGNPPYGYTIQAVRVQPSTVLVQGKPEFLRGLDSLDTLPIDVSSARQTITLDSLKLVYDEKHYRVEPSTVSASVEIRPLKGTVKYEVPVLLQLPPGAVGSVEPERVVITLFGFLPDLQRIPLEEISVVATPPQKAPGVYEVKLQVLVPATVEWSKVTPQEVRVEILSL